MRAPAAASATSGYGTPARPPSANPGGTKGRAFMTLHPTVTWSSRCGLTLAATLLAGCLAGDVIEGESADTTTAALATTPQKLVRKDSGKCLDVNGAGSADGTAIQQWTC